MSLLCHAFSESYFSCHVHHLIFRWNSCLCLHDSSLYGYLGCPSYLPSSFWIDSYLPRHHSYWGRCHSVLTHRSWGWSLDRILCRVIHLSSLPFLLIEPRFLVSYLRFRNLGSIHLSYSFLLVDGGDLFHTLVSSSIYLGLLVYFVLSPFVLNLIISSSHYPFLPLYF